MSKATLTMLLTLIASAPDVRAAASDVATATRDEATVLGFVGGAPLSPDEQATVAAYVAAKFDRDPKSGASDATGTAFSATVIAGRDARKRAIVREVYRTQIEGRPKTDAERQIIERHDPAIAYDAKTQFVVTEHTLDTVMAASTWAARVVGAAPPDPALRADARAQLASNFATFDHANQEAYAHIDRNVAVVLPMLIGETPAAQKATLLRWGHADDGHTLLAMTTAAFEMTAFMAGNGGGAGDPSLAILRGMTMRNLDQSNWQIRHPECGPMGSNPSSCGAAPIYQPVVPMP